MRGALDADGYAGLQDDSGGGSGGSLWLSANSFTGNGSLSANGGAGELSGGGGGGGGRVAIYSPANTFTGLVCVLGGTGATPGQAGTIFLAMNFTSFQVTAQTPLGVVSNVVYAVDLTFNGAVGPVSSAAFSLLTPSGPLPATNISAFSTGLSTVHVAFPNQNTLGDYTLQVSAALTDVVGQPLSPYSNSFTIVLPTISGQVTDTNGNPIAGVLLEPFLAGLNSTITDVTGKYSLGIPQGWTGVVVPSYGSSMFIPSSLSYTNQIGSITNQNFVMVPTIAPLLNSGLAGTNIYLRWAGYTGVSYQAFSSTNLTDWQFLGRVLPGSNGLMQLLVPRDSPPIQFFRVQASD